MPALRRLAATSDKCVTTLALTVVILAPGSRTGHIVTSNERMHHMAKAGKITACACIFSTLFMGCYTTALIDPAGEEKGKVFSNEILQVVTKDSVEYAFDQPANIVNDTIVGVIGVPVKEGILKKTVSIPLSNVSTVTVNDFSVLWTVVVAGTAVGLLLWMISSISFGTVPIGDFPMFQG
jgi:hypothetical protein